MVCGGVCVGVCWYAMECVNVGAWFVASLLSSTRWLLYGARKRDVTSMTDSKNDISNRRGFISMTVFQINA